MEVVVSRTSNAYGLNDEPPVDDARKERWVGVNSDGEEYEDTEWVITIDSIASFADSVAHDVIVSNPFHAGDFVNVNVEYKVEIYDDYRE